METDSILGNSGRLQINDTLLVKKIPTATNPISVLVRDSLDSNKVKQWPINSLSDSVRAAWKSDTSGKSHYSDSSGLSHISDTAKWARRPIPGAATSADTNLVARHGSDSTFKTLTRAQLRTVVDSVRASDTTRGTDLLDGYHKSYYDTVGNGAVYCDTPYVPYASTIGINDRYLKTIMKQQTNYLEIEPLDTLYASLLIPDNYYVSMTADNSGYIYALSYFGTPRLIRMTGAVGVYDSYNVKNRTWKALHYDKIDNTMYAAANYSGGNQGLYRWNNDSVDFIFYDSVYYSIDNSVNGITTSQSGDLFVCSFDNYIYRQIAKAGDFIPYADRRYWVSLCSVGDTIFAFTSNAGIFRKTPLGTSFDQYDATVRGYGQSWVDSSGNIYVVQNSAPMGIYRRSFGTTSFQLYHSYALTDVYGGTYNNGNNFVCTYNAAGDVHRFNAYYANKINRLTVNGSTTINGVVNANVESGTIALNVNGIMNCYGKSNLIDSVFLNTTPSIANDSILTIRTNGLVGYRILPDSNRATWKADSARKCGDSVLVVAFDDSITINSNSANVYQITLDSNTLIMPPTGAKSGKKIIFRFIQDNHGHRIVDWDTSAFRFSTDLEEPILSIDSLKTDYLGFIYNATASKWDLIGQVLGF